MARCSRRSSCSWRTEGPHPKRKTMARSASVFMSFTRSHEKFGHTSNIRINGTHSTSGASNLIATTLIPSPTVIIRSCVCTIHSNIFGWQKANTGKDWVASIRRSITTTVRRLQGSPIQGASSGAKNQEQAFMIGLLMAWALVKSLMIHPIGNEAANS